MLGAETPELPSVTRPSARHLVLAFLLLGPLVGMAFGFVILGLIERDLTIILGLLFPPALIIGFGFGFIPAALTLAVLLAFRRMAWPMSSYLAAMLGFVVTALVLLVVVGHTLGENLLDILFFCAGGAVSGYFCFRIALRWTRAREAER